MEKNSPYHLTHLVPCEFSRPKKNYETLRILLTLIPSQMCVYTYLICLNYIYIYIIYSIFIPKSLSLSLSLSHMITYHLSLSFLLH